MWFSDYQDVPNDGEFKKEKVEPGKGIIGCEMHERCGYQLDLHKDPPRKPGIIAAFLAWIFGD
jgi:hypothetical protein